jgi:hypothetical protein
MMNTTNTLFLAVFVLSASLVGCARSASRSYADYRTEIVSIRQKVVDLSAASDLLGVAHFVALYEDPRNSISNALCFLEDPSNSDETKMVVVYSLQKLPLDEYVVFEAKLLDMSRAQQFSSKLFNQAIFPGLEWSIKLQRNYQAPEVKALLNSIAQSSLVNEHNKSYISDILSGKAWKQILELQGSGVTVKRTD